MDDVLPELYAEFPEIDEKSIELICKAGLFGMLKMGRAKEELEIRMEDSEYIKLFVPCSPRTQKDLLYNNRRRKAAIEKKKQNG